MRIIFSRLRPVDGHATAAARRTIAAIIVTQCDGSGPTALEREPQTRVCRNNRARVLELLAPDFTEIGGTVLAG